MLSLFLDTHDKNVLIILFKDGKIVDKIDITSMNKHSVITLPSIKKILEDNNYSVRDLNEILVVNGPGSFTGSRIAVTIAKTLAYSLNVVIKQIDALTVMATNLSLDIKNVAILDRNGAYVGCFDKDTSPLKPFVYMSNKEYKEFLENNDVVENLDIDYEIVYNFLKMQKELNAHEVKPIYIKGISALNDK